MLVLYLGPWLECLAWAEGCSSGVGLRDWGSGRTASGVLSYHVRHRVCARWR